MIGPVRTRNRIIKTANGTSFMEEDQTVGPRMIAYYERLAKGGVGFLVVESCGVEYPLGIQHVHYRPDGSFEGVQLHLDDDKFIPGFQRLTEAVHKHGCPVSLQLQHAGPWNPTGLLPRDPKIRDVKCASALTQEELPGPDFLPCRAMTVQEIEDQIDLWAAAAERAWKAGFDACEINHGTCHQGNTFLSRVWNRREDEYGAQNFENRTRFLRSIIAEAKRRCGPSFAVHALINIVEYNHPLATTLAEGAAMAKRIAEAADGLNCRAERYGHRGGLIQPDRLLYPEPPDDLPADLDWSRGGRGATVPLAEAVKREGVRIPVWTACRLDAELGEEYLRRGSLDFVGMTRRLLADPELPNKVREGRLEDIRVCHGCLHCFDMRNRNKKLECRVNATLGRETLPEYQCRPAKQVKKVLVAGGGPAGMEAARIAAGRGHKVVLCEKGSFLGGLVPLAAVVKDRETEDLMGYVRYLETQLRKKNVTVRLKTAVTRDVLQAENPDVLVLAAGAAYAAADLPGAEYGKVLRMAGLQEMLRFALRFLPPRAVIRLSHLWMPVGRSVVILGGTLHGCELAEFLVKRGRKVTLVHSGPESEFGDGMTKDDVDSLRAWFQRKQVGVLFGAESARFVPEGLEIRIPGRGAQVLKAQNVIPTQVLAPNSRAVEELGGLVAETHVIGSCKSPGWIVDAVREGALVGYAV